MSRASSNLNDAAVALLKTALKDGQSFEGSHAIQTFLISQLSVKARHITPGKAAAWMRAARYELADEGISVTNPTPQNGFRHKAHADMEERTASRGTLQKHLSRRAGNMARLLSSDAIQPDADPQEIRDRTLLEAASTILEKVGQTNTRPSSP